MAPPTENKNPQRVSVAGRFSALMIGSADYSAALDNSSLPDTLSFPVIWLAPQGHTAAAPHGIHTRFPR